MFTIANESGQINPLLMYFTNVCSEHNRPISGIIVNQYNHKLVCNYNKNTKWFMFLFFRI